METTTDKNLLLMMQRLFYVYILAVSDLPVLVDADNGYGDEKNIVYLLHTYERLGAQALFFEDQVSPKRCGHMAGKQLIASEEMEKRIRVPQLANMLEGGD